MANFRMLSGTLAVAVIRHLSYQAFVDIFISDGENADKIVSRHIKLLHRYNEAKDAAQVCAFPRRRGEILTFTSVKILIGKVF